MIAIDFYAGFSWAVPVAFGSALQACRFERGDVLYSDRAAYDESTKRADPTRYQIQVLDPPRSAWAITSDAEGQRFTANWESSVIFEFTDRETGATTQRSATQGKLFSCLWHGDREWLEAGEEKRPVVPRLLRELQSRVGETTAVLQERLRDARTRQIFAFAHDLSSDASRVKVHAILAVLEARLATERCDLTVAEAGIEGAASFLPTLRICGMGLSTADPTQVSDVLKGVLYGANATQGDQPDRFRLSRHGVLVAAN